MQPNLNPYPTLGQSPNVPISFSPQAYIPLRPMGNNAPIPAHPFATLQSPHLSHSPEREETKENPLRATQTSVNEPTNSIRLLENFALTPGCGRKPAFVMCPLCKYQGMTFVEYKSGNRTCGVAIILCCLFWPVMCTPFCIEQCKYAVHKCPNCHYIITETPPFE